MNKDTATLTMKEVDGGRPVPSVCVKAETFVSHLTPPPKKRELSRIWIANGGFETLRYWCC